MIKNKKIGIIKIELDSEVNNISNLLETNGYKLIGITNTTYIENKLFLFFRHSPKMEHFSVIKSFLEVNTFFEKEHFFLDGCRGIELIKEKVFSERIKVCR